MILAQPSLIGIVFAFILFVCMGIQGKLLILLYKPPGKQTWEKKKGIGREALPHSQQNPYGTVRRLASFSDYHN